MSKTVTLTMSVREARRLALMLRLHSETADAKSSECVFAPSAYRAWRRASRKAWALAGDLELAARDAENAQPDWN